MKEFKGDKRTKAYKDWKKKYNKDSKGVGDTVEKITKATGIKKVVKWLAGEDCGCDQRQEELNKLLPYKKPKCLSEWEFIWKSDFRYYEPKMQCINDCPGRSQWRCFTFESKIPGYYLGHSITLSRLNRQKKYFVP